MQARASRIIAMLALLACLICPVVETFDTWDHTIQTGSDTEYSLVILALCVGVAYSFAHFIFKSTLIGVVGRTVFASSAQKSLLSAPNRITSLLFDATSPPPVLLRV
jgi:hypothetical protein